MEELCVCGRVGFFPSFVLDHPFTVFPLLYIKEILTMSFLSSSALLPPLSAEPSNIPSLFKNLNTELIQPALHGPYILLLPPITQGC